MYNVHTTFLDPPLPDRIKTGLKFDPHKLQKDLKCLDTAKWIDHFVKQNYQGDWSVLPLRGPANATHPVMMIYSDPNCTEFADTPFLAQCKYFQEVLNAFKCPLQAVRLMRLTVGSRIKQHTDYDLRAEQGFARLHIPVVTNDGVDFRLNGERVILEAGECWYLRLSDPHSVDNQGQEDRVHMVIDAILNPWLAALLKNQSAS